MFSFWEKVYISTLCVIFSLIVIFVVVSKRRTKSNDHHCLAVLCGAVLMVLLRELLQNPTFRVKSIFVIEPMVSMLGNMITLSCMEADEAFLRSFSGTNAGVNWKSVLTTMISSMILSITFTDALAVPMLLKMQTMGTNPSDVKLIFAILSGGTLGSTLTMTGSFHGLALVQYAYDDISWMEYSADHFLPTLIALCLFVFTGLVPLFRIESTQYAGLALQNDEEDVDTIDTDIMNRPDFLPLEQKKTTIDRPANAGGEDQGYSSPSGGNDCKCLIISFLVLLLVSFAVTMIQPASLLKLCGVLVLSVICAAPFSSRPVQITVFLATLLYAFNLQPALVSMIFACAWLFYYRYFKEPTNGNGDITTNSSRIPQLDFSRFLIWGGSIVMVSSLIDTGLPQTIIFTLVLQKCEDFTSGLFCFFSFSVIVLLSSVVFSRLTTIMIIAGTMPYLSPYKWMVIGFSVSIIGNFASVIQYHWRTEHFPVKTIFCSSLVPTLISFFVGGIVLSHLHASKDCSDRLGECSNY
mmetsp:Transcript_3422/g.5001  ORF Transcript_3422/g.5001 Transcript_3422/m.5001 type:complete len:523 (-) Transcript_3422:111-1679(-)